MAGEYSGSGTDLEDDQKTCRVCGDKAHAVNFNVLTCESCKAFFRRNALSAKNYHCIVDGQCPITVSTRKRCKSCRLKKCFEVGMMKEFIMNDDERIRKHKLVQENRAKRMSLLRYASAHGYTTIVERKSGDMEEESDRSSVVEPEMIDISAPPKDDPTTSSGPDTEEYISVPKAFLASLIFEVHKRNAEFIRDQLDHLDQTCHPTCSGPWTPAVKTEDLTSCQQQKKIKSGGSDNRLISIAHSTNIDLIHLLQREITVPTQVVQMNIGLSATKLAHLNGLKSAFRVMYDRWSFGSHDPLEVMTNKAKEGYQAPMIPIPDIIMRYDDLIRRLVTFCRHVPALKYLSRMDQIYLIKGAIEELMMLRGIHAYMPEQDGWRHTDPLGPVTPLVLLKYCKGNVYGIWKRMLSQFSRNYSLDDNIFLPILMMALFNPESKNISDPASVRIIRDFYLNTLLHYLMSIHGYEEGTRVWYDVMAQVDEVRRVCSRIVLNIVLELDPNDMEPLLIEAFGF